MEILQTFLKAGASFNHFRFFNRILLVVSGFMLFTCVSPGAKTNSLATKNVVIVVIDGPRWSETWGNTPGNIPHMSGELKNKGGFLGQFYNDGYTYTNSGHVAITTGVNQPIDNYGDELPINPSIFQYWLKSSGKPATSAWIISSKDKLHILSNAIDPEWRDQYQPSVNAGVNGPGTGYRADSLTTAKVKEILAQHKPNLVLINFMEPDGYAHAGNWDYYIRGIQRDDRYVKEIWEFIQSDPHYKDKTALIVTNDHGRHLDGIDGGWKEHGDNCKGCEHISLLALGPDFKSNNIVDMRHTLVDISPTVAKLLDFEMDPNIYLPRLDTTVVTFQADSAGIMVQRDSLKVVVALESAQLQGTAIRELFVDEKLRLIDK